MEIKEKVLRCICDSSSCPRLTIVSYTKRNVFSMGILKPRERKIKTEIILDRGNILELIDLLKDALE